MRKKYSREDMAAARERQRIAYEGTAIDKLNWELENYELGMFRPTPFDEWDGGPDIVRDILHDIRMRDVAIRMRDVTTTEPEAEPYKQPSDYPCIACEALVSHHDHWCSACDRVQTTPEGLFDQIVILEAKVAALQKRISWMSIAADCAEDSQWESIDTNIKLEKIVKLLREFKWDKARQLALSEDGEDG